MERNTAGLELRLVPQLLIDQPTISFGKGVQALLAEWHRFQTAARLLPLQAVQSPDFGMGLNAEQRNRLLRVPSRNNHHACTTGSRDEAALLTSAPRFLLKRDSITQRTNSPEAARDPPHYPAEPRRAR